MSETTHVKRHSSEIIAGAQELKQKFNVKKNRRFLHRRKQGKKGEAEKEDLRAEVNITEHEIPMEELLEQLGTHKDLGMTTDAVNRRHEVEGLNALTPPKTTPEWIKLVKEMTSFFALLLWAGSVLCFIGYTLQATVDNLYLGIVLAAVVVITGLFSYFQNRKSSQLMESFKNMMPSLTTVVRDGQPMEINAVQLVRGDIVHLKAGNKVPADIRVLECSDDMQVDNSSLTGESEPQKRSPECTDENPLETKNLAFFGTEVPRGSCTAVVINVGDHTVMGRIARLTTVTGSDETPIAREIHRFVKIVSAVAIILGIVFFFVGFFIGTDLITNLVFMIGLIVANVPEGLLATVTVGLARTANSMAKKSVLVKNLEGVETLGSTSCICSDKTGTLTLNTMTVAELVYDQRLWKSESSMHAESDVDPENEAFKRLQRCATLCNNAKWDASSRYRKAADGRADTTQPVPFRETVVLDDGLEMKHVNWKALGDASESAMIKLCQVFRDIDEFREEYPKVAEIPFNSANKYQVSVHRQPNTANPLLVMKGAPERIIDRCSHVYVDGAAVEFTPERVAEVEDLQLQMSRAGLRVLGFAELELDGSKYTQEYHFNTDNPNFPLGNSWRNPEEFLNADRAPTPNPESTEPLCFLGLMALIDPPRPQVPSAVARCKTAGIRVIMVTGDHPVTAKAIAHKVGILWSPSGDDIQQFNEKHGLREGHEAWRDPDLASAIVVPGWELSHEMPVEIWDDILDHPEVVFARTSPQQKLIIVENCQRRGDVVAVTGDGVNDAPALRKADIGVAMGIMGTDVSKEAADMILLDDNFASIVAGVEEGRLIFDNLKKSISYTLSSNFTELIPFLAFIAFQIPLPLSTILILAIDLGTDMVPAISMAWEAAESDIMRRPPRDSKVDHLVTRKLVCFSYLQIGAIQTVAGFYTYFVVLNDYGYPPHILPGIAVFDNWGKQVLYCRENQEFLGEFVDVNGNVFDGSGLLVGGTRTRAFYDAAWQGGFYFWRDYSGGQIEECHFASRNYASGINDLGLDIRGNATFAGGYTAHQTVVTQQSISVLKDLRFFEYIPWRAKESSFWENKWLAATVPDSDIPGVTDESPNDIIHFTHQPVGVWTGIDQAITFKDSPADVTAAVRELIDEYNADTGKPFFMANGDRYFGATYSYDGSPVNVASRMCQKEALHFAQCAYFVAIVVVQWADLVICKTRMNSLYHQGMANPAMNFGLIFETILAAFLCYLPGVGVALGTRPLRMLHWTPGVPFAIFIVLYDEVRKYLMRKYTYTHKDEETGQIHRDPCWLERFTYY